MDFKHFCLLLLFNALLGSFLTAQDAGLLLAQEELIGLANQQHYANQDIADPIISDDYVSGGIRHIYFQQAIDQIGIYGTSAGVHIKNNEIIAADLRFLKGIEKRNIKQDFQIQALEAIVRIAQTKGYPLSQTELIILDNDEANPQRPALLSPAGISNREIPLKLVLRFG